MKFSRGMTLVELTVSAGLFVVVAGGIYGAYAAGFRAWSQAQSALADLPQMTNVLEHLARQLRSGVALPQGAWSGGETGLVFPTAEEEVHPVTVSYRLDRDGRLTEEVSSMTGLETRSRLWLSRVERFSATFGYAGEDGALAWEPGWQDAEQVPRLVRVAIRVRRPQARPLVLVKTVLISTGVVGTYEWGAR